MEQLYNMSEREVARLEAIQALLGGQVSQAEIALRLKLSVRQVKRLLRAYRSKGVAALISTRRGRPSNRRTDPALIAAAVARVRERYADFGPTLACEKLVHDDGIIVRRERLRLAMIEAGIWQPKRKRRPRPHPPRERRPQFGELVQGDGSPHDWFEGRAARCSLLQFVDDATSAIGAALFAPAESTSAYFALVRQYLQQHGKPAAFYVDKLSVFRTSRPSERDDRTQFARAMDELDIELICANSPQAKGRVERSNRTLQDRLVKELRLRNISTIDEANTFLPRFIATYNARFAVEPKSELDAHRPLRNTEDLTRILTHTEERVVSKNLTVKYAGTLYRIAAPGRERRLQHARVQVRDADGTITLEHRGLPLAVQAMPLLQRPVLDAKAINDYVDRSRLGPRQPDPKKQHPPPPKHPWRAFQRRPTPTP